MRIRTAGAEDIEGCVDVLASLPEYFTESTHDEVRAALTDGLGVVAEDGPQLTGFTFTTRRYPTSAEITHAAVRPERRDQGIGTALLDRTVELLAADGVALVYAKTLDASAGYEPYVATRAFWERRHFVQIDCIDPPSRVGAGQPVRPLRASPAANLGRSRRRPRRRPSGSTIHQREQPLA